ncbi:hypothetical protein [Halorubrum halodurans]|uniref:DUF7981 domain-containing protein n=1 Tax=Halorubrum halodurans TaxID=1383851 RepID=A0A256IC18_9EURY|nr:hypothetical protein [Halorubrum halodurans]OYR54094.1 hypothetical protein DJ70_14730 [Halorubrum halodurans]
MSGGGEERDRDGAPAGDAPGRPATRRNRLRSAALWGAIGGFAFLVAAQGYLLVGGSLPFGYAWLFGLAATVAGATLALAYVAEHRIARRGAKRRT